MIASLYQSGASLGIATSGSNVRLFQFDDQCRMLGIESKLFASSDPAQRLSLEQILDHVILMLGDPEPVERHVDHGRLRRGGVETDGDEDVIPSRGVEPRIENHPRIVAGQKFEIE